MAPKEDGLSFVRVWFFDRLKQQFLEYIHGRCLSPWKTAVLPIFHPMDLPIFNLT